MKILKTILFIALAASSHAADGVTLTLHQVSVSTALAAYSSLSEMQLDIAPAATNYTKTVTIYIKRSLPKKDVVAKLASALREQAGVVIKPIDNKRASVTRTEK